MSQEDLNNANDHIDREKSTNNFNLEEHQPVITSTDNTNNQFSDKTLFDQDLSTADISNDLNTQQSVQSTTEREGTSENSGENGTETHIQESSVMTTSSSVSNTIDRKSHHENEDPESRNDVQDNKVVIESSNVGNPTNNEFQKDATSTDGDKDEDREEKSPSTTLNDPLDNRVGNDLNSKNLDQSESSEGQNEISNDSNQQDDEQIKEPSDDDVDYKDDFEADGEPLEQKENEDTNENELSDDAIKDALQTSSIENIISSNETLDNQEEAERTDSYSKKQIEDVNEPVYEDKGIIDDNSKTPRTVDNIDELGDTETTKTDNEPTGHDPDDSGAKTREITENETETLTTEANQQCVGITNDSSNTDTGDSTLLPDNLTQETYKADEDNDDFWNTDQDDKGNVKDSKLGEIKMDENLQGDNGKMSENESSKLDNERTNETSNQSGESKVPSGETIDKEENSQNINNVETENNRRIENSDTVNKEENTTVKTDRDQKEVTESKQPPPSPPPEPIKQESPLDQLLKRNVQIDGSVESITELDTNVVSLLQSMKDVMNHYMEQLKLQPLKEFTIDMGKFRGDFQSINDAYQRCAQLATTMNSHLKDLRRTTEETKTIMSRKFQNEDLSTWIDIPPEKEAEKSKLQEQVIAAEKASMAKAAEARAAVATATVGVAEAHQFVAETETLAAETEAIAQKASAHAQQALVVAEEARIAAEEKRKAEEVARLRAEERARKKEEDEKKKKAEEEMKIYQEATKKGTSVDDERKLLYEEKARREAERRDPKNWPRYTYHVNGGDYDPGVGCIIRAIDGTMRKDDVQCKRIAQESGILTLTNNEELISNIIEIVPSDPDRKFHFEEAMSVALPICVKRMPFGREAVIKIHQGKGRWSDLTAADVIFEDNREEKFVETRCKKFGIFVVVLRYKKDSLMLMKAGGKVTSSVDSRVSFTSKPSTFKVDTNFNLEILKHGLQSRPPSPKRAERKGRRRPFREAGSGHKQWKTVHPVDQNIISDLRTRIPRECEELMTSSPFIKLSLPTRKQLAKPITITLPLPPNQLRTKRPQTAVAKTSREVEARPATARPTSTQDRKEESTEDVHLLYLDEKTGWTKNNKTKIVQCTNKDIVTFDVMEPYTRFIVLRTKQGLKDTVVEKMASLLDKSLFQRNVTAFLRQRNDDLYDVVISCTNSDRAERALKYLVDAGFEEGAPPTKDLILQEGQSLYVKFRGNVTCITESPKLSLIYNTHMKCSTELKVTEKDVFAQKGLHCYRGFAQVFTKSLVPVPVQDGTKKPTELPDMVEAEVLLAELLIEIPKPEVEPPKPLKVVPVKFTDGPLNDSVLRYLAGELGKEWKDVAAHLNLRPMRIQAILRQNVNKDTTNTRYDMLVSWAKRIPKSVDKVQLLVNALQACSRPDLAEEIRYRGDEFRQKRVMSARVSHLRQAFVKVAKTVTVFKQWKHFAKDIGLPDDEIKKIEEQGGSGQEKCYSSLETWKEISGEQATIPALATHLKEARQDRLSRDVEALIAT